MALLPKKSVTLGDLARITQSGFEEMRGRFDKVEKRLDGVEHHLDRFEKIILGDHERRLKRLEADIDYLKNALAIK